MFGETTVQTASCHSSYDNVLSCYYRLGISDRVFGEMTVQTASCHSSYDNVLSCYYRLGISDRVFGETTVQTASCHSSYDNLDSEEESGTKRTFYFLTLPSFTKSKGIKAMTRNWYYQHPTLETKMGNNQNYKQT